MQVKFNIIHKFPSGKTMRDEEFTKNGIIVEYENNKEVFNNFMQIFSPNVIQRRSKQYECVKNRKERFKEELKALREGTDE